MKAEPRTADHIPTSDIATTMFWQGQPPPFRLGAVVTQDGNRFNAPGVPTVYLAGDVGLALIESGRNLPHDAELGTRAIWAAWVDVTGLVDLSRPDVEDALGLRGYWFLDVARCLEVAELVRGMHGATGLTVPSAGCPDDRSRTNRVLYVDRLRQPLEAVLLEPRVVGSIVDVR